MKKAIRICDNAGRPIGRKIAELERYLNKVYRYYVEQGREKEFFDWAYDTVQFAFQNYGYFALVLKDDDVKK